MGNVKEDLKNIIVTTADNLDKAQAAVKNWESKRNLFEKNYFNSQMDELKSQVTAVIEQGNRDIDNVINQYKKDIKDKMQLRGEDLTPDAKLLNGGFSLEKEDLEAIFDRNQDNYTMQVLTFRYASQHDMTITRAVPTVSRQLDAADTIGKYAKNALTRPGYREIWNDNNQWEKIAPSDLK